MSHANAALTPRHRLIVARCSRSSIVRQPWRGFQPSGLASRCLPLRAMTPTIGALQPISLAISTSRQPLACNLSASCFCSRLR